MSSQRIWFLFVSLLLLAIPILTPTILPIADLPQHMNQIILFQDWLQNADSQYTLQWWTPYSAIYPFLFIISAIFEPLLAARIAVLFVVSCVAIAIHTLAYLENRPAWNAVLACILIFNCSLYWGLLPFVFGMAIFLLWFRVTQFYINAEPTLYNDLRLIACGLCLYLSHALWFAAGLLWLGFYYLVARFSFKQLLRRTVPVAILVLVGIIGYLKLNATGFDSRTIYGPNPIQRLLPDNLVNSTLGGLAGTIEPIILASLLGWIILAIWQNRRELKEKTNAPLLVAAGMFLILSLTLPVLYKQTVLFSQRWAAPAVIFFVLALPNPSLKPSIKSMLSFTLLASFMLATCLHWLAFEEQDLRGLEDALAQVKPSHNVLGLGFYVPPEETDLFKHHSLIHIPAYTQLLHHGEINFSFAEFGSMPIIYKEIRQRPWSVDLEWFPGLATNTDILYFDHVLISGHEHDHAFFSKNPLIEPVTEQGIWRLYNVVQNKAAPSPNKDTVGTTP